jgi:peptide/nickel transport system substrate-binding protein
MAAARKRSAPRASGPLRIGFAALALVTTTSLAHGAEKVFTYAMSGEPESLDSAKAASVRATYVTWLLCDALINISKDGQRLESGLAESWTLSKDGLQAVIKLRGGVLFHDGGPVDARAVKASFDRHFRPSSELYTAEPGNSKERLLSDLIDDIQVQNGLTLTFKLKYPGLHYLSQVDIVNPAAIVRLGKEFGRKPVCSGPFKIDGWFQDRIVLAANDQYWAGRPRIDRVVFRFLAETKTELEALVRGEVDFSPFLVDTVFFERLRESPRVKLLPVSGLNVFYLGFYTERPPFNDPGLRRAVAHAVNVPRAALFLGRGAAVAARGPLAPAMKGYDPAVSQAYYDPDVARELLGKSGQSTPLTVGLLHNSAVTFDAEVAGAIQSDLRRIGIRVELLGKRSSGDVFKAARAREGDMFLYSWHLRAPYPERLLIPLFHSRSPQTTNLTQYKNLEIDRLLDEAPRLPEGPAQSRAYSQVQKLIVDDAPMVFLYHATRMAAYAARVQGLELNLGSLPHDKLLRVDLTP